jgi:hypothetical protein
MMEKKLTEFADGRWHVAERTLKCVFCANDKEYIRFRIRNIGARCYFSEIRRGRQRKNTAQFPTSTLQDGCKNVFDWLSANNFTVIN